MKTLKEWMDSSGVGLEEASQLFGKTIGTIRNWRSSGVPASQTDWVNKQIAAYESRRSENISDRLTLNPTAEQFDEWNSAALKSGKIIREWAMDALEDAASSELYDTGNKTTLRVAEPAQDHADHAKDGNSSPNDKNEESA